MANPLPCDTEDGNQAAMILSQTANGDTLYLCGPCLINWARVLLDLDAETEPEPAEAPAWDSIPARLAEPDTGTDPATESMLPGPATNAPGPDPAADQINAEARQALGWDESENRAAGEMLAAAEEPAAAAPAE